MSQWQPPQYPVPGPGRRQSPRKRNGAIIIGGVIAVIIAIGVATHGGGGPQPSTVTFAVSGSQANVTFGDAGNHAQGAVPMRETVTIGNPLYYSIDAQLQGNGAVTCEILVGDKVVSQATASGGYNIALCEISKDLFGQWRDATAGR